MPGEFAHLILAAYPALTAEQVGRLESHFELLQKWNKVLNLTAVRDPAEAIRRHYLESLFLASHVPVGPTRIVDVGSGAGFPGVPLAVFRPDCRVTLVESHQRKAAFLKESTRGWPNVRVEGRRAEDLDEMFDLVVSRAVRPQAVIALLPRLARTVMLLAGEEALSVRGVEWTDGMAVPDLPSTWLLVGRVPRGT